MSDHSSAEAAASIVLQAAHFEPLVGRYVQFGESGFILALASVDHSRGGAPNASVRTPFSLIFSGPKSAQHLRQGLYRCDFGEGAIFDIHVTPIHTPSSARQDYEAVFN